MFNIFVALAFLQKEVCSTTPFGLKRGGGGAVSVSKNDASLLTPSSEPKDAGTTDEIDDDDALLMRDIEMLSSFLDDVVKKENPGAHELFSILRKHGLDRAKNHSDESSLTKMKQIAKDLSPASVRDTLRVFSLALNLVNAAEVNHRLRIVLKRDLEEIRKTSVVGPLPVVDDGVHGTIEVTLGQNGDSTNTATKEQIFQQLISQKVELVLTAHPTEVNRKSILGRFRRISDMLGELDRSDLHPYQRSEAIDKIKRDIAAAWGSDEIRRVKPTPQQEASSGNAVVESVLWEAVPSYLRKLDKQCRVSLGKRLPIDVTPIKFASWIGGDRDGNPNVTPEITRQVVLMQRLRAANLFLTDFNALYSELAISNRYSEAMKELADTIKTSPDNIEKYRRVIGHLRNRLIKTTRDCEKELTSFGSGAVMRMKPDNQGSNFSPVFRTGTSVVEDIDALEPIRESKELMEPLLTMYDSLIETGFELVADGRIVDIIRRINVFGMTLLPLDIREESTKHTLVMDAITKHLGVGSYKAWDEEARLNFLQNELSNKRPLFRLDDLEQRNLVDEGVLKTLKVFEVASNLGSEALGAYVISQAQTASDVLAVMLLQKQFGMTPQSGKMMRVVPLFETLNDLTNASDVLKVLFGISQYVGAVKGKQEVMVGYSDSAKDAGRLAACWAQYTAQERMVKVAKENNVELTFFHGKGGTVGRGGNPALYRAVLSHPPGTINGRFRVTEQGEMITQNFGSPAIAERTLDIYTAAVLRETFVEHVQPKESWRELMQRISDKSCASYRDLVRDDPRFVTYFRKVTPELELGGLNIGSRPAKRNPKGGIESLRAIPWTFAWAQSRLNLSAWLGVGCGLKPENEEDKEKLKDMYNDWPWFREIIDLLSMILSKTDFSISANYDKILLDTQEHIDLGNEVRDQLVQTRQSVLDVSGSREFAGPHIQLLRTSSSIRNPYLDPINCLQAELLKELRLMGEEESDVKNIRKDALVFSINGIAQGMRNSG